MTTAPASKPETRTAPCGCTFTGRFSSHLGDPVIAAKWRNNEITGRQLNAHMNAAEKRLGKQSAHVGADHKPEGADPMTFPIEARFTGQGGLDSEVARAAEHLTLGRVYTVRRLDVGRSISYLTLDRFPDLRFNTCMFDAADRDGDEPELPDRWAELAQWLGTAVAEATEDARAWGAPTGSPRQVRAETLGQVRERMGEIEAGQ